MPALSGSVAPTRAGGGTPGRRRVRTAVGAALVLGALSSRNRPASGSGWPRWVSSSVSRRCAGCSRRARCGPAAGLPATILSRGLLTFAFFGADAYVTLTITTVRHHSTLMAGAVVTASTLAWTAGSWVQARLNDQWEGAGWCGSACVLILAGHGRHGLAVAPRRARRGGLRGLVRRRASAWGSSYAPISLMMLRAAPPGREGWASASLNLADVLGIALGVGVGGAAVAAVSRGARPVAGGVVIAFAVAALAAVVALFIAGASRARSTAAGETPAHSMSAADVAQPVVGGLPGRVGLAALLGAVLPGRRVRAEELHPGQPGVEVAQAVGHHLVADVAATGR